MRDREDFCMGFQYYNKFWKKIRKHEIKTSFMDLIITSQHSSLAQSNHHLDFLHPFALFFLYFSFCAFLSVWNSFYSGCEIFGPKRVDMVDALIYLMKLGREQKNVRTTRWPFVFKSKFFFLSNQNILNLKNHGLQL